MVSTIWEVQPLMKTNRSLLVFFLLNAVTCGIYGLIFWHEYAKDMNVVCAGDGKNTQGLLVRILLTLVTCGIYEYVWLYSAVDRVAMNSARRGVSATITGGSFLCWMIFGSMLCGIGPFIAYHKMFQGMNNLCAAYNAGNNGNNMGGATINVNINPNAF